MKDIRQIINKRLEEMLEGSKARFKTYDFIGANDLKIKEMEYIEILEDIVYKLSYMEILELLHYINNKHLSNMQYEKNEKRLAHKIFMYEMLDITISNIILSYKW